MNFEIFYPYHIEYIATIRENENTLGHILGMTKRRFRLFTSIAFFEESVPLEVNNRISNEKNAVLLNSQFIKISKGGSL